MISISGSGRISESQDTSVNLCAGAKSKRPLSHYGQLARQQPKETIMRRIMLTGLALAGLTIAAPAQPTGPYSVLKTVKVGGEGAFDYVYADSAGRKLYIPRRGTPPVVNVFDLDTLAPVGTIPGASAR